MKGYSITVDVSESGLTEDQLPQGLLILEPIHLYIIRIDRNRIRFASIAELNGWKDQTENPECVELLRDNASKWFPQLHDVLHSADAKILVGARPQSPDDRPIVSDTKLKNLYVNAGHGQYGWRLACGSAAVLESVVSATLAP